ncbi:MAG: class I SAM-dependent methyltransferase [Patescibacteria group bacterium]|nr:class I SAM-dependent methyltransferase [Patescibacteria group bacterium]
MNDLRKKCPLCLNDDIKLIEKIKTNDLESLFLKSLKINIRKPLDFNLGFVNYQICNGCKLGFFQPTILDSEELYASLQSLGWYYPANKEEYEYATRFITPNNKVLEIGAGKGAFGKIINVSDYLGLELNAGAAESAQKEGINVIAKNISDFRRDQKEKFDVVCLFQVLEHISDIKNFLADTIGCIGQNGKLIISVPDNEGFIGKLTNNVLNISPHHQTRWSFSSLKKIADIFSLDIVDVHRDRLSHLHKSLYFQAMILRHVFRQKQKLVNLDFVFKMESTVALFIGKAIGLVIFPLMSVSKKLPGGHSITVVFSKK